MYYEVKARYVTESDDGRKKKKNCTFLVDALYFGEAESKVLKLVNDSLDTLPEITAVKMSRIIEVINDGNNEDGNTGWQVNIDYHDVDLRTGEEKTFVYKTLFFSPTLPSINEPAIQEYMQGIDPNLNLFTLGSVVKTRIVKVV